MQIRWRDSSSHLLHSHKPLPAQQLGIVLVVPHATFIQPQCMLTVLCLLPVAAPAVAFAFPASFSRLFSQDIVNLFLYLLRILQEIQGNN